MSYRLHYCSIFLHPPRSTHTLSRPSFAPTPPPPPPNINHTKFYLSNLYDWTMSTVIAPCHHIRFNMHPVVACRAILMSWIVIVTTAVPVALAHSVRIYQYHGHHYTACVFSSDNEKWSLLWFQVSASR